jgi:hypothetical protein
VQQFNRFGSPDAGLDRSPSRNSSVGDGASNSGWISSSDADSVDALRETVYVEDYALPSDFRSSSLNDKSTSSDSDTDEQQYMSTMASSQFSEDTSSGISVKGCGRSRQAFYTLIVLKTSHLTRKTLAWTGRSPLLIARHEETVP